MTTIARQVAELQGLPIDELADRYTSLWDEVPAVRDKRWLYRRCAWKLQERAYGGLPPEAQEHLEELIGEIDTPLTGDAPPPRKRQPQRADGLTPGTTITRTWRGQELHLRVTETALELDGVPYRSLTAAARAATGSHWNGKLFWGLTERKRGS